MSTDRPSDEEFLKELAAFDEVLRRPAEPARPPIIPHDLGLTEPPALVTPPLDPVALRAAGPPPPLPPRRSRIREPWVAGLAAGLLSGGLVGWWLTATPIVRVSPARAAMTASSRTAPATPAAPRAVPPAAAAARRDAAPIRPEARPTRPEAAPSAAARVPAAVPAAATPVGAVPAERRAIAPPSSSIPIEEDVPALVARPVSPPPAIASRAGIPSAAIVPVPLMDAPPPGSSPMLPETASALAAAKKMAVVAADEAAIEATLRQYEQAYERLDAKAAIAVWPSVDRRALSRAFAGLTSQALSFKRCEVVVRAGASTATASCRGTAEYVRKVGDARVRVEPRQWTFTLNKTQGEWRIDAVDGRR